MAAQDDVTHRDPQPGRVGTEPPAADPQPNGRHADEDGSDSPAARRVVTVHRIGAFIVGGFLAVFGILGFVGGLDFFSTDGQRILGLSSNGLLSTISIATAVVLIAAGIRGGKIASLVMMAAGVLFLLSAFWHLFVLNTSLNFLAFAISNVIFSIVVGLILLTLGAYGRVSGNLPQDNPYYQASKVRRPDPAPETPETPADTPEARRAERQMREAELAVAEHRATPEQIRRVEAMSQVRSKTERRRVWLETTDRR